jgi:lysophospholipase L1-like esterase
MTEKNIKTSLSARIGLILLGLFLGLLILESGMRVAGFIIQAGNLKSPILETSNESDFIILTLGESTTENYKGISWPEQLERILNNKSLDSRVKIINKAIGGTNTAIIASHLRNYIEEYKPDMIITMMGINDAWAYTFFADNPPNKIELFFQDLRVVKLTRLIYINLKQKTPQKKIFLQTIPEEAIIHFDLGNQFYIKGDITNAEAEIKKAIDIYPSFEDAYIALGDIERLCHNNLTKAREYLEHALKINPDNPITLARIGLTLIETNATQSQEILKKTLAMDNADKDLIFQSLVLSYQVQNKSNEITSIVTKRGFFTNLSTEVKWKDNIRYHYRLMYKILKEKNITWAIMQYPTRDIQDFKDFFSEEEQDKLIFIENKINFQAALKNQSYETLFVDKFAFPRYSFGHCTELGNKLITENVVNAIFDKIKKTN